MTKTRFSNLDVFFEKYYNSIKPMDFAFRVIEIKDFNSIFDNYVILGLTHIKIKGGDDSFIDINNFYNYMEFMDPHKKIEVVPTDKVLGICFKAPLMSALSVLITQYCLQLIMFNDNKFKSKIDLTEKQMQEILNKTQEDYLKLDDNFMEPRNLLKLKSEYHMLRTPKFTPDKKEYTKLIDDREINKITYHKCVEAEIPRQLSEIVVKCFDNKYKPPFVLEPTESHNLDSEYVKLELKLSGASANIEELLSLVNAANSPFIDGGCYTKITYSCNKTIYIECIPDTALYILLFFIRIYKLDDDIMNTMIENVKRIARWYPHLIKALGI